MEITAQNYEEHALDYVEGTLAAEHREAFERFLADNPREAARVRGLLGGLPVLTPDASVRFGDKASLKRRAPVRMLYVRIASAAAVLLAGVLIISRLGTNEAGQPTAPLVVDAVPVPGQVQSGVFRPLVETDHHPTPPPKKRAAAEPIRRLSEPAQVARQEAQRPALAEAAQTSEPVVVPEPIVPLTAGISLKIKPETPVERVLSVAREYVIEHTNEPVMLVETPEIPLDEGNRAGFLNVLSVSGFRSFASRVIAPLSEISPIRVDETNAERVVRFASIPVSRRLKPEQENQ